MDGTDRKPQRMMASPEMILSTSPEETEACGEALGKRLEPGAVVLLQGDLAAGKTTFVRGLLRGLGGDPVDSSSPTFVVVQTYPCSGKISQLHHIDLYRLPDDSEALREIGLEDFLSDEDAVVAVEWPRPSLSSFVGSGVMRWRVVFERENDENQGIRRITLSNSG